MLEFSDGQTPPRVHVSTFAVTDYFSADLSARIRNAQLTDPNLESSENATLVEEIKDILEKDNAFQRSADGKVANLYLSMSTSIESLLYKCADYESLDKHEWALGTDTVAENLRVADESLATRLPFVFSNLKLVERRGSELIDECLDLGESPWELDVQAAIFEFHMEWGRTIGSGLMQSGLISKCDDLELQVNDAENFIRVLQRQLRDVWMRTRPSLSKSSAQLVVGANRMIQSCLGKIPHRHPQLSRVLSPDELEIIFDHSWKSISSWMREGKIRFCKLSDKAYLVDRALLPVDFEERLVANRCGNSKTVNAAARRIQTAPSKQLKGE